MDVMKLAVLIPVLAFPMEARTCLQVRAQTAVGEEVSKLDVTLHSLRGAVVGEPQNFEVPRDKICVEQGEYLLRVIAPGFRSARRIVAVQGDEPVVVSVLLAVGLELGMIHSRCSFVAPRAREDGRDGAVVRSVRLMALDVDLPVQDIAVDEEGKFTAGLDNRANYVAVLFVNARMAGAVTVSPSGGCREPIRIAAGRGVGGP